MDIKSITRNGYIAELHIESDNTKISEDVSQVDKGVWFVDDKIIDQLITAAFDFSRFSNQRDADSVFKIAEAFLNKSEREELIEKLQETVNA